MPEGQRLENLRHLHQTYHQLYWHSADSLAKVWSFYLAITATLVGYVVSREIADNLTPGILAGAVVVTVLSVVFFGAWAWGLRRITILLRHITERLDGTLYDDLDMQRLFRDWDRLLVYITIGTVAIGGMFTGGLLWLYRT